MCTFLCKRLPCIATPVIHRLCDISLFNHVKNMHSNFFKAEHFRLPLVVHEHCQFSHRLLPAYLIGHTALLIVVDISFLSLLVSLNIKYT